MGLKARVGSTLQHLDASRRLAAATVASLAEMDRVKQRMEAAASTLKVSRDDPHMASVDRHAQSASAALHGRPLSPNTLQPGHTICNQALST